MDMMETRFRMMAMMGGNGMVGIKQAVAIPNENSTSITFQVESKPWGALIARNSDSPIDGISVVTRLSAIWSEYNNGGYVGGRYTITRANGNFDHYALNASNFVYDDVNKTCTITVATGSTFAAGETYYLWYFTIPF